MDAANGVRGILFKEPYKGVVRRQLTPQGNRLFQRSAEEAVGGGLCNVRLMLFILRRALTNPTAITYLGMHSDIHMYGVPIKAVRVSTSRVGKQLWRRRRKIMNGKNLLRTIGGFVLAASLLFGVAIMSSTAVQAQHGGGGHGGGGMGGGGGHGGGGMGGGGFHGGGGVPGGGGGHVSGGVHRGWG